MSAPSPRPLYFGPLGRESFGWLHAPASGAGAPLGLVICSPFGNEDQASHRSLRHLAIAAARLGIPTLRFDGFGTGDAAGLDEVNDHPTSWVASVHDAIDLLRNESGVAQVCLFGMRLGAMLGALAASTRNDVAAFAALAPVSSGRGYLRELTLRSEAGPRGEVGATTPADALETGGFVMTSTARAELLTIDLARLPRPPAPQVLIVQRDDVTTSDKWASHLRERGAVVRSEAWPGYAAMVSADLSNPAPMALVEGIAEWVRAQAANLTAPAQPATALPVCAPRAVLDLSGRGAGERAVRESPVSIAGPALLAGVISEPARGRVSKAVVLLNVGAASRVGPSRMYVGWARHWASQGVAVLRLDLPGLGDSEPNPGEREGEVYACTTTPAIAAAVALLKTRFNGVDCHLAGICSGAFHALKAAVAGVPVQSLTLINPATFFWDDQTQRGETPMAWRVADALVDVEREKILGPARAVRHNPLKLHSALAAAATLNVLRDATRPLGLQWRHDLGGDLRALAQRRVRLHFVFSEMERGRNLLALHGGRTVGAMQRRDELGVHHLAHADHIFTTRDSRRRLLRLLDRLHGRDTTLSPQGQKTNARSC